MFFRKIERSLNQKYYFNQFLLILLLSMIGNIFLVFLSNDIHELPIYLSVFSFVIFSLFYGVLAWFGIKFSVKAKLQSLNPHKFLKTDLAPALIGSCVALILIFIFNRILIKIPVEDMTFLDASPYWTKIISAFYSGLNDEILFRLFLLSLIYYLLKKIKINTKIFQTIFIWTAILLAAMTPIALNFITIDSLTISRLIILHLVGGIVYGYLYVYKSFWAAAIAHFTVEFLLTGL